MTCSNPSNDDFNQSVSAVVDVLKKLDAEDRTLLHEKQVIDIGSEIRSTLASPTDFPPLSAAIVSGDQVAIALDSSLPSVDRLLSTLVDELSANDCGKIDIVLGGESSDRERTELQSLLGERAELHLHQTTQRASFRYLGPDVEGDPVYINRWLVDADLVIPVATKRPLNHSKGSKSDVTGIYPTFTDAEARKRNHLSRTKADEDYPESIEQDLEAMTGTAEEPAWLLGVQLIISVTPNQNGEIAEIDCGSIESQRRKMIEPSSADLCDFFTAFIDGNPSQHTWMNVARAAESAAEYTNPGGTIVIWSSVAEQTTESADLEAGLKEPSEETGGEEDFEPWDEKLVPFERLEAICEDYQVILRSRLPIESVEKTGLGSIESPEEVERLAMAFPRRGFLRAAQYHAHS